MLKFHPTSSPLSNAIPFQSNKSQPTTRHSTLHSITQSVDSHSSCTVVRVCLCTTIFLYQSAEFHCSTAITVALSFAFDLTNSLLAHHNSCLLICDFHQSIRSHILNYHWFAREINKSAFNRQSSKPSNDRPYQGLSSQLIPSDQFNLSLSFLPTKWVIAQQPSLVLIFKFNTVRRGSAVLTRSRLFALDDNTKESETATTSPSSQSELA